MTAKYKVTVWKTEIYLTTIEVCASNRHKAATLAQERACEDDKITWAFVESEIEADVPVSGISLD